MRDNALLMFLTYCVCKGLMYVFAASAVFTDAVWTFARAVLT